MIRMTSLLLRASALVRNRVPSLHPYWSGFWLGILPERALAALDEELYRGRPSYSGMEHNLSGLFPWEDEAIRLYFAGAKKVMVLAIGGGRELVALLRAGFDAEGWECNPALLEVAKRIMEAEGHPGVVHPMERNRCPDVRERYDAAILGWSMYMLVPGRDRRIRLLRDVRTHLTAGSPILISFFTRGPEETRAGRVLAVAAKLRRLRRSMPPDLGDDLAPNYLHRFTRAEVGDELSEGGFEMVRCEPMGPGPRDSGWAVGVAR